MQTFRVCLSERALKTKGLIPRGLPRNVSPELALGFNTLYFYLTNILWLEKIFVDLLTGDKMRVQPKVEEHYGKRVFVNPTTEYIRRAECLCLNCGNLKPGQPDNCQIAQALFEVCVRENVALAVTRCPIWKTKETSPEASSSSCCGKGPYKD